MRVDIDGPVGRIEALEELPEESPRFAAIVCHPHPAKGGTLQNHATYRLAKAVRARGGISLRFNYRGVGRSAGRYDEGRGEREDTRAALAWLGARYPALPLYASGFSFGAWMALAVACSGESPVRGVLAAGMVPSFFDLEFARAWERPIAAIQAEGDPFGSPGEVEVLLRGSVGPRRLDRVPGTTHLFQEDLARFQQMVQSALSWLLEIS